MTLLSRRAEVLAIVGALAFFLRLYFSFSQAPAPLIGDALGYHAYAVHLLDERRYEDDSGQRASRMPGYPFFLATVYSLAGRSSRAIQAAQCLLSAATCVLISVLACSFLPEAWALAVGFLAAFYFDLISPCRLLLSESLYQFFLTASFVGLYRFSWKPTRRAAAFGAGLGAAYLVRPEALLPGLAALTLAPLVKEMKFTWRKSLAATAVIAALMAPWVLRSRIIFHRWLPSSTVGGYTLYSGLYFPLERRGLIAEPFYSPPSGDDELKADAAYAAQFKSLWARAGLKRSIKGYAFNFSTLFYPFLPGYDATFVLLLPFWLAALALSLKRRVLIPLSAATLALIAVYTVFGGPVSRYRQEYAPLCVCLAGAAIFELYQRKPEILKRVGPLWVAINAALWLFPHASRHFILALRDLTFR